MGFYLVLILLAYIVISAIEYWLDDLNIKHLKKHGNTVPPEFGGVIDQALLTKTSNYVIAKNRFSTITSLVSHAVLLLFLFAGGLNWYAQWIAGLGLSFILSGILFFLVLTYAQTIINLPFSWYANFKLEAKYRFNTMTKKVWVGDIIKSLLIFTILLTILIAGGLLLVEKFPFTWWIWVWGFFLIFSVFIMYLSPYVLEPLFNKFTPIEKEELAEQIKQLLAKVNLRVNRVFQMDASRRSKHTNAYFTGIGKVKRIVLFDTLLEKMNDLEILAVLAHEAGHWKKKHVLKRLIFSEVLGILLIYLAFLVLQSNLLLDLFRISADSFYAKSMILGFLFSLLAFPFGPLMNAWSRKHERDADSFACQLTGEVDGLSQALIKLSSDNLSNLHPHPWYAAFHYSHPPVVERIRRIRDVSQSRQAE
ncbi:M48 family metallopeptidase [bacterium]|nr:M48 family metallopeptidase [bacterium]